MLNQTIAAIIAANTPLTPARYRLVAVPGTELGDTCPYCDGAHTLPQCAAWAAAAGQPLIPAMRTELDEARHLIDALHDACTEAHALLWHYNIVRQPNGVEWGPVEILKAEQIDQLWNAIVAARAWLKEGR